jgi:hypothetical protein
LSGIVGDADFPITIWNRLILLTLATMAYEMMMVMMTMGVIASSNGKVGTCMQGLS